MTNSDLRSRWKLPHTLRTAISWWAGSNELAEARTGQAPQHVRWMRTERMGKDTTRSEMFQLVSFLPVCQYVRSISEKHIKYPNSGQEIMTFSAEYYVLIQSVMPTTYSITVKWKIELTGCCGDTWKSCTVEFELLRSCWWPVGAWWSRSVVEQVGGRADS